MVQNLQEMLWTGQEVEVAVPVDGDAFDLFSRRFSEQDTDFRRSVKIRAGNPYNLQGSRRHDYPIQEICFPNSVQNARLGFNSFGINEEGGQLYKGVLEIVSGKSIFKYHTAVEIVVSQKDETSKEWTLRMKPLVDTERGRLNLATQPQETNFEEFAQYFGLTRGVLQDMGYIAEVKPTEQ